MREGEMMSKNETDGIRNARERARESAKSKETFVGLTDSRGRSLHRSYVLSSSTPPHAAFIVTRAVDAATRPRSLERGTYDP